jgi:hypothetical protein
MSGVEQDVQPRYRISPRQLPDMATHPTSGVARRWVVLCLTMFAVGATGSGSQARASVLVLDACMKQCDADDLRAIGLVRLALQTAPKRTDMIADVHSVIDRFGSNVPFLAIEDPRLTVTALTEHLKLGIASWAEGRHKEAAEHLATALAEAAENPAIVVSDPTLRQLIPRAYVGWAVSLTRLNRVEEAKQAIAELVRATPETSIRDSWGTEAERIFQLSRKELAARGTGTLTVQIDDSSAIFYIDEAGQPHGTMFTADVLPGIYRVFVLDTTGRSRRYRVEVVPHHRTVLDINWHRDSCLEVRPEPRRVRIETRHGLDFEATMSPRQPRVGFTFSSYEERRREGNYSREIAAKTKSDLVAVIGRIRWKGDPALVGVLYQPGMTEPARVGIVPLVGEPEAERTLADFLSDREPEVPGVTSLAAPPWERLPAVEGDGRHIDLDYVLGWTLGLGTIAGGGVLVALADDSPTRVSGFVVGGLGVALVALTTGYYWRSRSRPSVPILSVMPTASGVTVSASVRF